MESWWRLESQELGNLCSSRRRGLGFCFAESWGKKGTGSHPMGGAHRQWSHVSPGPRFQEVRSGGS